MFEVGRLYRRREIHEQYKGQRYGGIITPKDFPLVFLVTGEAGRQYGYKDYLDDNSGVFHYYGEGQTGDMEFTAGNAAIRDHAKNEEELHLFDLIRPGYLRYRGEMACSGYKWVDDEDQDGNLRKAIVFHLVAVSDEEPIADEAPEPGVSLEQLRNEADTDPAEERDPQQGRRKVYGRGKRLRQYVRIRANGRCEGCEQPAPFEALDDLPYLEPHHTLRRSDHGPGNRRTVIALCPTCHRLVHYGVGGSDYNEELKAKLEEIEP